MSVPAAIKGAPAAPPVQEYVIRVPKNSRKKYNVMRFNATLNVDFAKWSQVKLERENNMKEYKGFDEDMPKFGAGSEFGRDAREEARRKKYGINSRKYKPDDQPWILKSGGKTGKKFKGIREGGISENTAYYVFTHATDGAIEAFPLQEWYNFQPIQRYKTLSAEEAEEEFSNRNKRLNYFNLMMRKRARNNEEDADDDLELADAGKKIKGIKREKELKISEMDEWMDSDDDSDGSETEKKKGSDEESDSDKKKKTGKPVKKKKKKGSDDEAFDDSDDGDVEGRECDYISDSSNSESDGDQHKQSKSVAEEDALRKLLASDEEDEDEQKDKDKQALEDEDANDEEKRKDDAAKEADKKKDKKKKKSKKNSKKKDGKKGNSSSDSSSDSDTDPDTTKFKDKDSKDKNSNSKKPNSLQNSKSATPPPGTSGGSTDSLKRKHNESPDNLANKKTKTDNISNPTPAVVSTPISIPGSSESGITEEAVRRYLTRKPMTATELLQKFKSKKSGLNSEKLVLIMTQILKKINPTKQTIKNKMYLSIKQ